jgi:hypothetical protein
MKGPVPSGSVRFRAFFSELRTEPTVRFGQNDEPWTKPKSGSKMVQFMFKIGSDQTEPYISVKITLFKASSYTTYYNVVYCKEIIISSSMIVTNIGQTRSIQTLVKALNVFSSLLCC